MCLESSCFFSIWVRRPGCRIWILYLLLAWEVDFLEYCHFFAMNCAGCFELDAHPFTSHLWFKPGFLIGHVGCKHVFQRSPHRQGQVPDHLDWIQILPWHWSLHQSILLYAVVKGRGSLGFWGWLVTNVVCIHGMQGCMNQQGLNARLRDIIIGWLL